MNLKGTVPERIHSLEIPIADLSLIVPSASIAEVTHVVPLRTIPLAAPWLIGVLGWRMLAVPIVSFESLMGTTPRSPTPSSKIVIFYPLAGRGDWEFFGLISAAEPRPRVLEPAATAPATPSDLPDNGFIAAGLRIDGKLFVIPDFDALKATFYP